MKAFSGSVDSIVRMGYIGIEKNLLTATHVQQLKGLDIYHKLADFFLIFEQDLLHLVVKIF